MGQFLSTLWHCASERAHIPCNIFVYQPAAFLVFVYDQNRGDLNTEVSAFFGPLPCTSYYWLSCVARIQQLVGRNTWYKDAPSAPGEWQESHPRNRREP